MKLNVNHPAYVIGFAAVLSAVFTAAVVSVQVATRARIERNEALREQKALVRVFGLGDVAKLSSREIAGLVEQRVTHKEAVTDPETGREFRVFATDEAVAFEFRGTGFWAPITGLLALTPDLSKVVGLVVVEQAETPGLGGRITEDAFQEQFAGLNVAPPPEGRAFLYLERDKPTDQRDPRMGRTVEAITGATETSMALGRLLNANVEEFRRAMGLKQLMRSMPERVRRAMAGE